MTLNDLRCGDRAVVTRMNVEGKLRQHFLDMGLLPGAEVRMVKRAPMGDPIELRLHGYELTLRMAAAARIEVSAEAEPMPSIDVEPVALPPSEHPGLGETGPRFHDAERQPQPKTKLTFALVGNQNCGKTTLFNQLTGANQHVGNFPGVTVERKEGTVKGHPTATVVDLPGIYSLSPFSQEEIVSRRFITEERPDAIINIVDATAIERSLYLTLQLMELDVPMVLLLNMMDEVENNRGSIRVNDMEALLGIPVVPISAMKGQGIEEAIEHAIHVARYSERPVRPNPCSIVESTEAEEAATRRYGFISAVCRRTVVHPSESKEFRRSLALDKVLTGRWTALPVFALIIAFVFWLTFSSLGPWLQDMLDEAIGAAADWTADLLEAWNIAPAVVSLVIDGVFEGVGSVLSFLPVILLLFFSLSMLEDTGYLARIAFVTDGLMRKVGLSGRSIVPLLIGFGCSVPSIMASRTLPSERDRKMTVMLTPFMSCTAKLPIYLFFVAAFFPGAQAAVIATVYVLGVAVGVAVSAVERRVLFRGEAVPFVMELPNYRLPVARNVVQLIWDKCKDFLVRAFTIIFMASMVVWFLKSFDWHLHLLSEDAMAQSILASISAWVSPIFAPLGCADWRVVTSLVTGMIAKEAVVSTLTALVGEGAITALFSAATAWALLLFCLIYSPCMAAMATVRRELGGKWALGMFVTQCLVAWIAAWVVYNVARLLIG